jgi:mono/diheme cytochrome c family protein
MSAERVDDNLRHSGLRWSPALFKAAICSLFALAFVIPLGLVATPFIEFFNGMAAQPKGRTQMTYGRVFDQERLVDRLPVDGTMPRGYVSPPFAEMGNTIEDAQKVGQALRNPVPLTMDNLLQGQAQFNVFCGACHGETGVGDGPVTGPDRFPAPASLHTEQALQYADGTIYHVITRGVGKMPSYAHLLEPQERWQVVHYVRALQRAMNPKPEDLEP